MTLLVRPHAPDAAGIVTDITPETAGWTYVGFRLVKLSPGERYSAEEADRETCLVPVTGRATIVAGSERIADLGGRATPFDGPPVAIYVPAGTAYSVEAVSALELAICTAPAAAADRTVRLIASDTIATEVRGEGTNTRFVRTILSDTSEAAERLLVVEVITPGGNWSSYPPHKHDLDAWPEETFLEETYYHRLKRPGGFAFQRVYTDDRSIDETMSVGDGDTVMVPRGYHPVGAAHGYDLYYLNVMAGPLRAWKFRNDPAHAWIAETRPSAQD